MWKKCFLINVMIVKQLENKLIDLTQTHQDHRWYKLGVHLHNAPASITKAARTPVRVTSLTTAQKVKKMFEVVAYQDIRFTAIAEINRTHKNRLGTVLVLSGDITRIVFLVFLQPIYIYIIQMKPAVGQCRNEGLKQL